MRGLQLLLVSFAFAGASIDAQEPADPFADLTDSATAEPAPPKRSFFTDNFGFRKEIMSEFDSSDHGQPASRQSLGFEMLKKFSSGTSTLASFNFQGRLVRRDGFQPVLNDMEGETRGGWAFEYHNLYLDLYNLFKNVGHLNFRVGRFYVPFGLNLQTDTHGTVLQLSNEQNLGFERDWYTGLWGTINKHLNYDAYYLAGSGYDLKYKGQKGLGALRLSLSNKYSSEYGLEGGVSVMGGERLSHYTQRPVETRRVGVDGRYRHTAGPGVVTFTSELSAGRDVPDSVYSQLIQTEYLHGSRRWGVATQYRRFELERMGTDASIIGEFTWYFRNDVGNSNLHWIKLNVERRLQRMPGSPALVVALQYYFYR